MAFQSDVPQYRSNAEYLTRLDRLLQKKTPGQPGYLTRRIVRYTGVAGIWIGAVWTPIVGYLTSVPPSYTSTTSLILPGSGANASVNLESIGQASSYANSAFSSNAVSPTQTYKRLIRGDRIMDAAAMKLGVHRSELPRPKVNLVDQTGLIHFEMVGGSPEQAQIRAEAIMDAFFSEVDALRTDDQTVREQGAVEAIEEYRNSVKDTRTAVSDLRKETGFISQDQFSAQVAENDERYARIIALRAELDEKTAFVQALEKTLGLSAQHAARALDLYSDREYLALSEDAADKAAIVSEARSRYGSRHPRLIKARADFAEAQQQALLRAIAITGLDEFRAARLNLGQFGDRTALLSDLVRNEADRAGLEAQWQSTTNRYETEKSRLERASRAAAELEDLQRDFQVAEAVFASAIARVQTTKADVFASYPLVQVLQNPSLPEDPTSPRRKLALLAGIAATMMIMITLSLGWMRRSIIRWLIGLREGRADV